MKISIFGYFHLADGYLAFADSIRNEHSVSFFPLMAYVKDNIDSTEITVQKFLEGGLDMNSTHYYHNMVLPDYNLGVPDVLLFWVPAVDVSQLVIEIRKFYSGKIIFHNWDPNYTEINHQHWVGQTKALLVNAKQSDCVLTVNPLEVEFYKRNGIKSVHCYSGFCEKYSYLVDDANYKCDVSAVITNLYTDSVWDLNRQKINRKKLIDDLYADKSINLKIYGPEKFRSQYPDSYVREIRYNECNKVFSNSRVNLCVHAISIDGYLSERAAQIIGSKGLLYTDNVIGLNFIPGQDYVLVKNDAYQQIKDLLKTNIPEVIAENGYNKRNSLDWSRLMDLIKEI